MTLKPWQIAGLFLLGVLLVVAWEVGAHFGTYLATVRPKQ